MFDANGDEDGFLGIAAQIQVFLVVPDVLGVGPVDVVLLELVLAEPAVQELTVAEVEIDLQPFLGIGHCPESLGAEVHLREGLRVGALHKRAR